MPFDEISVSEPDQQIKLLCTYMEEHYSKNIQLDDLVAMTNFSKSYLLRSFTRQIGVSPYRYLQTIRIDRAKKLLEQGILPIDAAVMTGFADQSIGLTPKQYQRIFINPKGKKNE